MVSSGSNNHDVDFASDFLSNHVVPVWFTVVVSAVVSDVVGPLDKNCSPAFGAEFSLSAQAPELQLAKRMPQQLFSNGRVEGCTANR